MNIYARIEDGRVVELFDCDGPIADHFGDQPGWVDVTAVKTRPVEGSTTSDGGKTFAPPVVVAPAPEVRTATGYALVMALTDDQRALYGSLKAWDQRRLSLRGSDHIPEDNPLIARAAVVLKTDPKAWFDAALGAD